MTEFKKDQIVTITYGEYDDTIEYIVRVLKDFTTSELQKHYRNSSRLEQNSSYYEFLDFARFMEEEGYVASIETGNIFLGYSKLFEGSMNFND